MTASELARLVENGARPVVEACKGPIVDLETCIEPGMRGRIVGVRVEDSFDNVLVFSVELNEFEQHNASFESRVWYGKDRELVTAREAGFYPKDGIEAVFLMPEDAESFSLVDDVKTDIFNRFLESGSTLSYVSWLEDQLVAN